MKHELHLNATPEAVWQELTKQGRNDWYFLLDVDGTFTAGELEPWALERTWKNCWPVWLDLRIRAATLSL